MNTAVPSAQEGLSAGVQRRLARRHRDAADQIDTRIVRDAATEAAPTSIGARALPADLEKHPRYYILEFLGAGGMGSVFKARHRLMNRIVALKVIHPDWAGEPAMVERFAREIRAASRLCHPNIVAAHDAERVGVTHLLVMEFVQGETLEDYLAGHADSGHPCPNDRSAPQAPIGQVCDYIRQAAVGLQHAHERGVVHHDIKPHNLMLTPSGQLKILDFGLARFSDEPELGVCLDVSPYAEPDTILEGAEHAQTPCWRGRKVEEVAAGYPMGTVDYLAPEEVDDPRRADIRGDIYSLGCTLYRCLTGQVPFAGRTLVQKLKGHRQGTPTPLADLRPDVPAALGRIVARMMAKDPAQRYQTPAEAAAALARFTDTG
jgi:serine/threonine protein kinase